MSNIIKFIKTINFKNANCKYTTINKKGNVVFKHHKINFKAKCIIAFNVDNNQLSINLLSNCSNALLHINNIQKAQIMRKINKIISIKAKFSV